MTYQLILELHCWIKVPIQLEFWEVRIFQTVYLILYHYFKLFYFLAKAVGEYLINFRLIIFVLTIFFPNFNSNKGEPPLCLSPCVFFAVKHSIEAARADQGKNDYFDMVAPATFEVGQQNCLNDYTQFKLFSN